MWWDGEWPRPPRRRYDPPIPMRMWSRPAKIAYCVIFLILMFLILGPYAL